MTDIGPPTYKTIIFALNRQFRSDPTTTPLPPWIEARTEIDEGVWDLCTGEVYNKVILSLQQKVQYGHRL